MAYYSVPHPLIPCNDGIATTSCDDAYSFSHLVVSFPLSALVQAPLYVIPSHLHPFLLSLRFFVHGIQYPSCSECGLLRPMISEQILFFFFPFFELGY